MTEMGHLIYCPQSENLRSVVRTLQSLSMCVCVCVCVRAWVRGCGCPLTVATLICLLEHHERSGVARVVMIGVCVPGDVS